MLYCHKIKMNQFLSWLCSEEPKPDNWEDIYNEYMSLREHKDGEFILEIIKEIGYLETKLYITSSICDFLSYSYDRDLVNELKGLGYKGKFDWSNKAQYFSDLKAVISSSKKLIGQIDRKNKELDKYRAKYSGEDINRNQFIADSVTIGKYLTYRVDFEAISVAEWCHMINSYNKYCEVKNAMANNILDK
jgi:hypothetical protein